MLCLANRLTNNTVHVIHHPVNTMTHWGAVAVCFEKWHQCSVIDLCSCMRGLSDTHIDQSKVVFIDWKLLRADVFLQSRGIGALKGQNRKTWDCALSCRHLHRLMWHSLHINVYGESRGWNQNLICESVCSQINMEILCSQQTTGYWSFRAPATRSEVLNVLLR